MTKPLSEEVAKKYGYENRPFREWLDNYFDSLELEKRKNEIKPIKMRVRDDRLDTGSRNPLLYLTSEMMGYVVQERFKTKTNRIEGRIILNPNYIYAIRPEGYGTSEYYIPIENPFDSKTQSSIRNMRGVHRDSSGFHTYTSEGFDPTRYRVIGILRFPFQIEFMNWQTNPLR